MATATITEPTGTINPVTGHVDDDEAAIFRAIGPDQPDPPSITGRNSNQQQTYVPFGWLRPQVEDLPGRRMPYQGPPGGGFGPPRGLPGGGPPGGGYPGGPPPPMPMPPPPQNIGRNSDKLVGNTPTIFTGDRSKAEEFITQWQVYEGVNIMNELMRNAYQRAMLFLTYMQGPMVNEWVKGVNAWLWDQVLVQRWATTDERLWRQVFDSFNRQFANVMEQEEARAKLQAGLELE
jgi:hypothetical protein